MTEPPPVPATVATYDAATRVRHAAGRRRRRLAFDGAALDPAVRLLRSGQRVRVVLARGAGRGRSGSSAVGLPFT